MTGLSGFININKPAGITSGDVVYRVRKILKEKQVGHGGTLDPMAVGVLPIAVGNACRLLRFLPQDKVYTAEILLGTETETCDIEGKVTAIREVNVEPSEVERALQSFAGEIDQVPPAYSAIHVNGKRLYELARKGEVPENIPSRKVTIYKIELLETAIPRLKVQVSCSSGTYIRAIARDLGANLGCGGTLSGLIRDHAAGFDVSSAITLEQLQERTEKALIPCEEALTLARVELSEARALRLCQGQTIELAEDALAAEERLPVSSQDFTQVFCGHKLIAICNRIMDGRTVLKPEVVLHRSGGKGD